MLRATSRILDQCLEDFVYLFTLRTAVVFGAAVFLAATTVALIRADGHSWPTSLLGGGAAFGGMLTLADGAISDAGVVGA